MEDDEALQKKEEGVVTGKPWEVMLALPDPHIMIHFIKLVVI
jgi:hypothetical protein